MSEQYVPTTEEVRDTYEWGVHACGCCATPDEESLAQFDRWLAKHDAEVAAKALSDVSASIKQERPEMGMHILPTPYRDGKCHGLDLAESIVRARAAEYRKAVQS